VPDRRTEGPLASRADAVFDALADPTRRQVLQALASGGAATATELAARFPVSRQAVVKHLAALGAADLVVGEREGREVRYRLTPAPMADAVEWMASVGAAWDARLERLQRQVSGPREARADGG
jgi:DNA-binding transcriptional ArsR family regulator